MGILDLTFNNEFDKRKFTNLLKQDKIRKLKREFPDQYAVWNEKEKAKRLRLRQKRRKRIPWKDMVGPPRPFGGVPGPHNYPPDAWQKFKRRVRRNGLPRMKDGCEHKPTQKNPGGAGRPHNPIDFKQRHAEETKIYEMMSLLDSVVDFAHIDGFYDTKYKPQEKLFAVCAWLATGSLKQASIHTGIPHGTLGTWKGTDWWSQCLDTIRKDKQGELDIAFTGLIHKAAEVIDDRLENGDFKLDKGTLYRVPVSAKDAVVVTGALVDKRALMRGDPTKRVETTTSERLNKLQEQFEKFAMAKQIEGTAEVVEEEGDE